VNCNKIINKNNYYKIQNEGLFNYQLLIHELEAGSLLLPIVKTIHQLVDNYILHRSTESKTNFKIFNQIYNKQSNNYLRKDLNVNNVESMPITLFIPFDDAFYNSNLNINQIESIISDEKCCNHFLMANIRFKEETCPNKLMLIKDLVNSSFSFKKRTDGISFTDFIFNDQIVSSLRSDINMASNGMIFRLRTVKVKGIIEFLFDIVMNLKKRISTQFINSLEPNWMDILKTNSTNVTLFLPFHHHDQQYKVETTINERINIRDYMTTPRYSHYDLKDGQILKSLTNKKYLITVYPSDVEAIPKYMNFLPLRSFERKSINCVRLEIPDIDACSSSIIIFANKLNTNSIIKELDTKSLLHFIETEADLSFFKIIIDHCGEECAEIFLDLERNKKGFTLLLPNNYFFSRELDNFKRYARNKNYLLLKIKENIFNGTFCADHLNDTNDFKLNNLLDMSVRSKTVFKRIKSFNCYLNENGLLIHKTDTF
jgi:hypothetical protein